MTAILMLLKATALQSLTAAVLGLPGRRLSAASRHLICTLGLAALLVLPILSSLLPSWTAVRLTTPAPAIAAAALAAPSIDMAPPGTAADGIVEPPAPVRPSPAPLSWTTIFLAVYAIGVLILLVRLVASRRSIGELARRATAVDDPEWQRLFRDCLGILGTSRPVRLLRSCDQTMPMAVGILNAAILVPAEADTWSADRRRAVLLHELAHVARFDCLTQTVAALVCALYWIHPGVWWLARRLRVERELACDDLVLSAGADAREYAGHLLELAYALRSHPSMALAVSMASPRQLEGRMLAALDAARNRTVPALGSRLAGLIILIVVAAPIAAATAVLSSAPAPIGFAATAIEAPGSDQSARTTPASAQSPGTWDIRRSGDAGTVHLQLREADHSHGFSIELDRLAGLTAAQLAGSGPVQFRIVRDAGTFTFEGVVRAGVGGGTFDFTASETFAADLAKRGFTRPSSAELRRLALADIGFGFLDELEKQGYARPSMALLVRAADHGVNAVYLREMGALGYRLGKIEALIEQRDHGVSPQYIRGLAAQGLTRLTIDDLMRARDHGVSPDYISGLKELGYGPFGLEELIRLRDHGLGPEYIRDLGALGFTRLSIDALLDARNRGISPDYIRELNALGYRWTMADLATARDHGVDPEYVRDLSALGYKSLTLDDLVRLRNHGVDPSFVRDFQQLGYTSLTLDELMGLRSSGVSADRTRQANARAGSRLSVDRLRALAATGWR